MDDLLAAVQPWVDRFGGVGMAVIAAIDTSFISMPGVSDLLLVWQTIKHPDRWWYYVAMTTLGSSVGSLVIYYLGRKGGEAFLIRRFRPAHVARARQLFARYGLWAMLVVAFVPPPAPYKIFVLLAGVGGIGTKAFLFAVTAGRGLRFAGEGWLARLYGHEAASFVRMHLSSVALWVLAVGTIGLLIWFVLERRRPAPPA